jgi:hypothetical protein
MATTGSSLGIAIGIDAAICLIIVLLFGYWRSLRITSKFYQPKAFLGGPNTPQQLGPGLFNWMIPTIKYTEQDVVKYNGTDAAMYYRVQKLGIHLFLFCTFFCCVFLLPIHITRGHFVDNQVASGNDEYNNLDKTSLSNLEPKVKALWADWLAVWAVSLYLYWLLWNANKHAVKMRIAHLNIVDSGAESHTVLVNDVPAVKKDVLDTVSSVTKKLPSVDKLTKIPLSGKRSNSNKNGAPFAPGDSTQPDVEFQDAREDFSRAGSSTPSLPDVEEGRPLQSPLYGAPTTAAPQNHVGRQSQPPSNAAKEVPIEVDSARTLHVQPRTEGDTVASSMQSSPEKVMPDEPVSLRTASELFSAKARAQMLLKAGLTPEEMVRREFEDLYPNKVEAARIVCNTKKLDKLYKSYEKVKGKLEDLLDKYQMKMERHKKIKKRDTVRIYPAYYGKWGEQTFGDKPKKVDALEFFTIRLRYLKDQIVEEQGKARDNALPTAFVTFKTRMAQTVAATAMMHHDRRFWNTAAAPSPTQEVIWPNLGQSGLERMLRFIMAWALLFVIASFYLIPIGAIQALIEVQKLEKYPFFSTITQVKFLNSIITAIVPGLVLTIFLALLPSLLSQINRQIQKMVSEGDVDLGMGRKYFAFQVITTFIGSLLAGSFLSQFNEFVHNPTGIVNTLGSAAPQTATFFMSFILVQAFIKQPLNWLRLPGLIFFWLRYRIATTPRQKARVWQDVEQKYGKYVANDGIILLLGLVFCVMQPLIAPLALIYFLLGALFAKYNAVYVYKPTVETGGKYWMQIVQNTMTALILFQIIMLVLFGIKKAPAQAILTFPLPILSVLFLTVSLKLFSKPQVIMSLRTAADVDKLEQRGLHQPLLTQQEQPEEIADQYVPPSFHLDTQELDELLEEARRVDPTVTDYIATYTKEGKKGKGGKKAKQTDLEAGSAPTSTIA